jgi:hypothetical protein
MKPFRGVPYILVNRTSIGFVSSTLNHHYSKQLSSGANPTIAQYNASAVKSYICMSSLVGFKQSRMDCLHKQNPNYKPKIELY